MGSSDKADGNGASMELINPALDNNLGSSWRPSYTAPLFPGPSDPPPPAGTGLLSNVVHRWSFNGNLNDSVGGSTATCVTNRIRGVRFFRIGGGHLSLGRRNGSFGTAQLGTVIISLLARGAAFFSKCR